MKIGGYLSRCFRRQRRHTPPPLSSAAVAARRHSAIAFITGIDRSFSSESDRELDSDYVYEGEEGSLEQNATSTAKKKQMKKKLTAEGVGVLIYPWLLLTTHNTLPSVTSAQNASFSLRYNDNSLSVLHRKFLPQRFFATDAELNVTVVACEYVSREMKPMGLDASAIHGLEAGSKVYIMGYKEDDLVQNKQQQKERRKKEEEGEVAVRRCRTVMGTGYYVVLGGGLRGQEMEVEVSADLADLSSHSLANGKGGEEEVRLRWAEGSPGFDESGGFAFVVTGHGHDDDEHGHHGRRSRLRAATVASIRRWLEPFWTPHKPSSSSSSANPNPHPPATYIRIADFSTTPCCKPSRLPSSNPNPNPTSAPPIISPRLPPHAKKVPSRHKKINSTIHSSDHDSSHKPSPRLRNSARNQKQQNASTVRNPNRSPRVLQPSNRMERSNTSEKSCEHGHGKRSGRQNKDHTADHRLLQLKLADL